jgi:hypothetical protein
MVLGFAPEVRNPLKDLVAGERNAPNAHAIPYEFSIT